MSDMGTFRVTVELENPARLGERRSVAAVLVDSGAELSWFPQDVLDALRIERHEKRRFRLATNTIVERWVGQAIVFAGGKRTGDDVVFAETGDRSLLGARSLEGLNVRIDPTTKQLVDAGPILAMAVTE